MATIKIMMNVDYHLGPVCSRRLFEYNYVNTSDYVVELILPSPSNSLSAPSVSVTKASTVMY